MQKSKRNGARWSQERYEQYMREKFPGHNPVSVANNKPGAGDVAKRKDAIKKKCETSYFEGPVRIRVHSVRKRAVDADGVFSKWAIDALVLAGVLYDDDPAHVKEISHTQAVSTEEETEIICHAETAKQ